MARRLAQDEFAIAVNGLHSVELDSVVAEIRELGCTGVGFVADVADEQAVEVDASSETESGSLIESHGLHPPTL
jgi:hypothetical protein